MESGILRQRAELLNRLRQFFVELGFLEVETPLAAREAIPERTIALAGTTDGRFLQASPEMHHKRLLCAGAGQIFEVTKSFRGEELGALHNSEFTLVEWYRPGDCLRDGMTLVEQLLEDVTGATSAKRTTYRDAFSRALAVDPHTATDDELRRLAVSLGVASELGDRDDSLNELLALAVEPLLGRDGPEFLYHYPASQAALAATVVDEHGTHVAERFELYWQGIELANGYHELTDATELRRRLEAANDQRAAAGWPRVPMPEALLADMADPGLPPCTGVALGFDRLVMLAIGAKSISDVRLFCEGESA
ncbi:MAG: EF-P lysine aminoacylase EpmA [Planctomycetota bacterium]